MQASEPNHPPTAGNTPLHFASWKGDAARADALLKSDAVDALALNSRGQSPVHLAAAAGHAGVLATLLDAAPEAVDARTGQEGDTPLLLAVGRGHVRAAAQLLASRADPCAANKEGVLPPTGAASSTTPFLPSLTPAPLLRG